jgi:hypothetical protein
VAARGNAAPAATAVLRQTTAGNLNFETGVPAVSTVTNGIMFGVSDAVYRTALAVVNRSSSAAEIKLTAYRADGTLAAPSRTISLAPNEHRPRFLDELIPELAGTFDGVIVLDSTAPVHVITLRTVTNSLNAFLMTAMPVIDLNQVPPPATRYFPQLVDGGNYSTEYLILSTGGTSSSLRFFSTSGEPLLLPLR